MTKDNQEKKYEKRILRKAKYISDNEYSKKKHGNYNTYYKKLCAELEEKYKKNYIPIDGQGKNIENIIYTYISHIENGFDLTVDEIANYLSCSKRYITDHIRYEVKHVAVTDFIKSAIRKQNLATGERIMDSILADFEEEKGERLLHLLKKRVLFDRKDFYERYIRENTEIERIYKTIPLSLFETNSKAEIINQNLKKYKKLLSSENIDLYHVIMETISQIDKDSDCVELVGIVANIPIYKPRPITIGMTDLDIIPETLVKLKELQEEYGINHDNKTYELLRRKGIRKYIVNKNLKRYDLEEFKEKSKKNDITITYRKYLKLKETMTDNEIVDYIFKKALSLIK